MTTGSAPAADYGHTPAAESNRRRKAHALSGAAWSMGLQPYELTVVGGGAQEAELRSRVRRAARLDRDPSVETWQAAIGQLMARIMTMPGTAPCPRCDWHVREVITEAGTRLLIDPLAHPAGTVWPVTTPDGQRAKVLAGHDERPDDVPLYRQHSTTCPAQARPSRHYRCQVCSRPLDQQLAHRDPTYRTHPRCDDGEEVRPP